jgi:hypothetical protein
VFSPTRCLFSPVNKLDRRHTGRLRKRDSLLTGGGGNKGVGEEPNHPTMRKPGPLFMIEDEEEQMKEKLEEAFR